MTDTLKKQVGQKAEESASAFLQKKGLRLLARNYRCLFGEIDIIMQHDDDIVFIEVRKRNNTEFGSAVESVNKTKQKKIIKSAISYLRTKQWLGKVNCRFDIIGISRDQFEWIKNAFSMEARYCI